MMNGCQAKQSSNERRHDETGFAQRLVQCDDEDVLSATRSGTDAARITGCLHHYVRPIVANVQPKNRSDRFKCLPSHRNQRLQARVGGEHQYCLQPVAIRARPPMFPLSRRFGTSVTKISCRKEQKMPNPGILSCVATRFLLHDPWQRLESVGLGVEASRR